MLGCDESIKGRSFFMVPPKRSKNVKYEDHSISSSEVSSSLPLAKVMGAKVTAHLHQKVTHVLCDMIECDLLHWHPSISLKIFRDFERGLSLHERLKEMNVDYSINIILVSPRWIRNHWV